MALPPRLRHLAICSGIGGFDLGLRLALGPEGLLTVCHIEREAYAAAVLVSRMAEGWLDQAPVWSDVATFDPAPWIGAVDIATAGFPCQPWARVGKRQGEKDERYLWDDILRVFREVRPGLIMLENSSDLVLDGGLGRILGDLASIGFDAEWDVFSAFSSGAPHRRRRFYLLGWDVLAHPNGPRLEGCGAEGAWKEIPPAGRRSGWPAEPELDRLAHGLPHHVDRTRAYGNAVLPQVVARAFRTLLGRAVR